MPKRPVFINCEHCGNEFKRRRSTTRFCSKRCSNLGAPRHRQADGLTFYERNAERIKAERNDRYANDPDYRKRVLARAAARKHHPDPQPCEQCGTEPADRHHDDYDKPLEIRWLCRECHIQHHAEVEGTWGYGFRRLQSVHVLRQGPEV